MRLRAIRVPIPFTYEQANLMWASLELRNPMPIGMICHHTCQINEHELRFVVFYADDLTTDESEADSRSPSFLVHNAKVH